MVGILRHGVRWFELALDEASAVNYFVIELFTAAEHHSGHGTGGILHQVLPESLVINVKYGRYFLLEQLKHDPSLVSEA